MGKILVSGLVNLETSAKVDRFPIEYSPIDYPFFGVETCVSGVGFNVAKALKTLGSKADLISEIGDDLGGEMVVSQAKKDGIDPSHLLVCPGCKTAESVVLVDKEGKRKIYCDLKDLQEKEPLTGRDIDLEKYSLAVLTNINFNRRLLDEAKGKGIIIATDVHLISSLDDSYNRDFMEKADILFFSNEGILGREGDFMREVFGRYHNEIIVCGCGKEGALLYIGKADRFHFEKAVAPRGIVSTVGAGDALFSAFLHFYNKGLNPEECLHKAVLFAGVKISEAGGSSGFISEQELASL